MLRALEPTHMRASATPQPTATERVAPIALTQREVESYSLTRALEAAQQGNWRDAGFEWELSEEGFRRTGQPNAFHKHAFRVPHQILASHKRDLTVASATGGGFLASDVQVQGVLDVLRPRMVTARLGAQYLPGLKSNVTYARTASSSTVTWHPTEATASTETANYNMGQISLVPKTCSAYVETSRLLRLMAPDLAEFTIRRDLARTLATAVDAAAFTGSGASGEPTGLLSAAGIGTFTGASLAYAGLLEAQTDILNANALSDGGQVAFTCRPAVASLLANRQGFSTLLPMWTGPLAAGQLIGCPAVSTMQIPASTLVAGDFSQMLLAEWAGGIEIRVNPYANFPAGIFGYAAFLTMDVGVLQSTSFSVATSVS